MSKGLSGRRRWSTTNIMFLYLHRIRGSRSISLPWAERDLLTHLSPSPLAYLDYRDLGRPC